MQVNTKTIMKQYEWAGRVFYEIKVNDELQGYEEVIHILKGSLEDPFEKLEEIAKANESCYTGSCGNKVEVTLYKVKEVQIINQQSGQDSIEVYSNVIPATKKEIDEYMRIAFDLHEDSEAVSQIVATIDIEIITKPFKACCIFAYLT